LHVCIDFQNLNSTTPKDEYPMPVVDMLVDSAVGNEMLSLLDGYSCYNQIYEWTVMPLFGLKNAGMPLLECLLKKMKMEQNVQFIILVEF